MIKVDAPSGATSQTRATKSPQSRLLETFKCTRGVPRSSNGSVSAGVSKQTDFASSTRWSCGSSATPDHGIYSPLVSPVDKGEFILTVVPDAVA